MKLQNEAEHYLVGVEALINLVERNSKFTIATSHVSGGASVGGLAVCTAEINSIQIGLIGTR